MRLPDTYRDTFARPMGRLIPDDMVGVDAIHQVLSGHDPVVTVGDRTTERVLEYDIHIDIQIVDGIEQRKARTVPGDAHHIIRCQNPTSCITSDAVSAIRQGYDIWKRHDRYRSDSESTSDIRRRYDARQSIRILVSGEEDLLLLPALILAPYDAVLLYGQPNEGLVVVYADDATKRRGEHLMSLLKGDDETVAG